MHIFYSPEAIEGKFYLDEEESRHALKVLRLKERDKIIVVDGKGGFFNAEISNTSGKLCEVTTINVQWEYQKRNYFIHIAIAPTKNADRIEWFTEKAVEIGIDKISFIQCSHSERKNINTDRINKIATSAMKQSLKAYMPEISELTSFKKFVASVKESQKFIAHLEEMERKELKDSIEKNARYCILIGPEGDFSPEEINMAKENGFLSVSLGDSRLRTETAGIVSCHILNLINS